MKRWPWFTMIAAAVAILSPFGVNLIYLAFFTGEQLSRNIAQPFLLIAVAVISTLIALEWLIRKRRYDKKP